jgi:hypothetical protein
MYVGVKMTVLADESNVDSKNMCGFTFIIISIMSMINEMYTIWLKNMGQGATDLAGNIM